MPERVYDAAKAHDYYVRTRKLKGRQKGTEEAPSGRSPQGPKKPPAKKKASAKDQQAAAAKVEAIRGKLDRLRALLKEKQAKSGKPASKSHQQDVKEQKQDKAYYEEHKQELKSKRGKGSGGSSAKTAKDMDVDELKTAIRNTVVQLKAAIAKAKQTRGG